MTSHKSIYVYLDAMSLKLEFWGLFGGVLL